MNARSFRRSAFCALPSWRKCEQKSPLNINYICVVHRSHGISMWFVHQSHGRRQPNIVDASRFLGKKTHITQTNTRSHCNYFFASLYAILSFCTLHYPFCWSFYVSFCARQLLSQLTHFFVSFAFRVFVFVRCGRRNCSAESPSPRPETQFRRRT